MNLVAAAPQTLPPLSAFGKKGACPLSSGGLSPFFPNALSADPSALAAQAHSGNKQSIDSVASGFESMFLSMILKEMRQTLEPGSLFSNDTSDVQGGLFDLFMGQHLAHTGGIGIGRMVKQYLQRSEHS